MNSEKFNALLKEYQPDLFKKISAEQSGLSEKILEIRLSSGYDVPKMAKILRLSQEDYLKYEFGDLDFSVDEYKEVIAKMKIFTSKSIMLNISNVLIDYLEIEKTRHNEWDKSFDTISVDITIDLETDEFQVGNPEFRSSDVRVANESLTGREFIATARQITSSLFNYGERRPVHEKKFKELEVVNI